jgi:hypothetical protein
VDGRTKRIEEASFQCLESANEIADPRFADSGSLISPCAPVGLAAPLSACRPTTLEFSLLSVKVAVGGWGTLGRPGFYCTSLG